jgi:hypothetical protein
VTQPAAVSPPAVGNPDTTGRRTALYLTTLGLLFGALTERSLQDRRRRQPAAAAP